MVRWVFRISVALLGLAVCTTVAGAHFQNQAGSSSDAPYTLILVDFTSKNDLSPARDFLSSQGGRVAIVLPPHPLMGWISPEADSRLLGRLGIRSIHRTPVTSPPAGFRDRDSQVAIKAFNDIASGRSARRRARESAQKVGVEGRQGMIDCSLPHPSINKDEFIR